MSTSDPYTALLGTTVRVVIDRPLGSAHPEFGFIYPLNYGYVPGTLAGDGLEIDAYILGVDEAVDMYEGRVIALLRRHDDVEDKLVVAAPGSFFDDRAILEAVAFQERHFDTDLIRPADPPRHSSSFLYSPVAVPYNAPT